MLDEPPPPGPTRDTAALRRAVATALVVVASVLAFAAIWSVWVNRQLLDTDNWTTTSSRLLANPTIRDQVATSLVDEIYATNDVTAVVRDALPARAKPLAPAAASGLRNLAERGAAEVLARPRGQRAWEDANRAAHRLLLQTLEGGGTTVSAQGGTVVLDLQALLAQTQERIGVGRRLAGAIPPGSARIVILRADQLSLAQDVFRTLRALPVVLVVLSLALFGGAVAIAPRRRRPTVRAYGLGLVAAGAAALAAASLAGDAVVGSLARTEASKPAIEAAWTISTTLLEQVAVATIGYGVVMVAAAWLAGPTGWAVGARRALAPYLREPALTYGALAAILAAVILWWAPTPATRNPVTALVLVGLVALGTEALRRQTARELPGASRAVAAQRRRERMARLADTLRRGTRAGGDVVVRQASATTTAAATGLRRGGGNSAPEPSPDELRLEQLERLARLHESGVLDDAELRAEKARILGDSRAVGA